MHVGREIAGVVLAKHYLEVANDAIIVSVFVAFVAVFFSKRPVCGCASACALRL